MKSALPQEQSLVFPNSWESPAILQDWLDRTAHQELEPSPHILSTRKPVELWVEALPIGNGIIGAMSHARPGGVLLTTNRHDAWSGSPSSAYPHVRAHDDPDFLETVRAAITEQDFARAESLLMSTQSTHSQAFLPYVDVDICTFENPTTSASGHSAQQAFAHGLDFSTATVTSVQGSQLVAHSTFAPHTSDQYAAVVHVVSNHSDADFEITVDMSSQVRAYRGVSGTTFVELPSDVAPTHEDVPQHVNYTSPTPRIGAFSLATHVWPHNHSLNADETTLDNAAPNNAPVNAARLTPTPPSTQGANEQEAGHSSESTPKWQCGSYRVTLPSHTSLALVMMSSPFTALAVPPAVHLDASAHEARGEAIAHIAATLGHETAARARTLAATIAHNPQTFHREHVRNHRALYNQCALDVANQLPATRLFNFGRYLLISSYAPQSNPLNLQGLWSNELPPPWSSNYTLNINTPMNYWAVESTGLGVLHTQLHSWLTKVVKGPGAAAARDLYNMDGFVLHHNSDMWGHAHPVGAGEGDPCWAYWPMGGIWLTRHMWDHYEYSQDPAVLEAVWPIIEAAGQFAEQWIETTEHGSRTAPSMSPENRFLHDGQAHSVTSTTTMDIALLTDLARYALLAHRELFGTNAHAPTWLTQLKRKTEQLPPYQVGSHGQLQEWLEDHQEVEPDHRHLSHLIGVYPLGQITPTTHPELAAASTQTITLRGRDSTGWSLAWRIALWARLENGEMTSDAIDRLLRPALSTSWEPKDSAPAESAQDDSAPAESVPEDGAPEESSAESNSGHRGGLYPNMFAAHPPFQIDGNFGYVAGVVEALAHTIDTSRGPILKVLPARPPQWTTGHARGIRLRRGYTIDVAWNDQGLLDITLHDTRRTGAPRSLTLSHANFTATVMTSPTETLRITSENGRFGSPTQVS